MKNKFTAKSHARLVTGAKKSAQVQKGIKTQKITVYNECPKRCKECNQHLSYEKRFNIYCGRSCSAKANNRGVKRNAGAKTSGKFVVKDCLVCGAKTKNEKFCGRRYAEGKSY